MKGEIALLMDLGQDGWPGKAALVLGKDDHHYFFPEGGSHEEKLAGVNSWRIGVRRGRIRGGIQFIKQ